MILAIVDCYNDEFCLKKEYPYPMLLIESGESFIKVNNRGHEEIIDREKIKKINKINISDLDFKKII